MKVKAKIILPHIYLLTYPNRYELCMSFVRMQEFYESASPKFKGKYFTLEDYIDYWSLEHGRSSFTYPSVWNGFNLPSDVFIKWTDVFNKDKRARENVIIEKVGKLRLKEYNKETMFSVKDFKDEVSAKYYVIGINKEDHDDSALEHEIAHAFYYLYPEYRKSCNKLLDNISEESYESAKRILLGMGYCKAVINDELQAYYSCDNGIVDVYPEFVENLKSFKEDLRREEE